MLPLVLFGVGLGALAYASRTNAPSAPPASRARVGYSPETQPTRPSCTECVTKHLGAAWVLMTEHRDGYPHRLRAIGHLHEAEDESQHWPELHVAIREARKAYYREGVVPDFKELARLVEAAEDGKLASV